MLVETEKKKILKACLLIQKTIDFIASLFFASTNLHHCSSVCPSDFHSFTCVANLYSGIILFGVFKHQYRASFWSKIETCKGYIALFFAIMFYK